MFLLFLKIIILRSKLYDLLNSIGRSFNINLISNDWFDHALTTNGCYNSSKSVCCKLAVIVNS